MYSRLLFIFLAILGISSYSYADCAALTDTQVESVRNPLIQLLNVTDDYAENGNVSSQTSQAIEQLKLSLVSLVDARIACETTSNIKAESIQEDLLRVLRLSELDESKAIYGYDLQIVVQRSITPQLLIVHVSFGIPCGSDNLLIVYRYRNKSWHRDLLWKSNPYKSIVGAYSDYYDYLVLPSKIGETPKLVITYGTAWCTSAWNPSSINVIKLADVNTPQKMLLQKQVVTYTGSEADATLKKLSDGFELRIKVGMLDSDLLSRQGIYRYQLDGDKIIRVQPVAENVRDFVDEWLTLDKHAALQLIDKTNAQELIKLQTQLKERYGYYGAVTACEVGEEAYQVAMTFNGTLENDKEELFYFIVKPTRYGYLLKSASKVADSSCIGSDIMAK